MAKYCNKKFREDVLTEGPDPKTVYLYNKTLTIWEKKDYVCFKTSVIDFIVKKVSKLEKKKFDNFDEAKSFKSCQNKVTKKSYMTETAEYLISKIYNYWNKKGDENPIKKLNSKHDYLPIKNNLIINLKTGKTKERSREDYFTTFCPVSYLEKDKMKEATKFIMDICGDDEELFNYLVRYLGYSLTGRIDDRSFAQFYGAGLNGKSKLMEVMKKILGDVFFKTGSRDIVVASNTSNKGSASSYLMNLPFARLVSIGEPKEGDKLDTSIVKGITGGDEQSARQLFGEQKEINLWCKIIVNTNNPLSFNTSDKAIIDRLRLIPFTQEFVAKPTRENQKKADNKFIEKIKTEYLDQVFTLLVKKGSKKWYENPLNSFAEYPKVVEEERKKYIGSMDILECFMNEALVKDSKESFDRVLFYSDYKRWRNENGYGKVTSNKVYLELEKKGCKKCHISRNGKSGYNGYTGYRLKEDLGNNNDKLDE